MIPALNICLSLNTLKFLLDEVLFLLVFDDETSQKAHALRGTIGFRTQEGLALRLMQRPSGPLTFGRTVVSGFALGATVQRSLARKKEDFKRG